MLCIVSLLAYLDRPSARERIWLPSIALGSLLVGASFHMLMLLIVPPLLVMGFMLQRARSEAFRLADWKRPLQVFCLPYSAFFIYLGWTFLRGTAYDYQRPSLLSMGSVLYHFVGLFGYGPNRHYDIPFRPYLFSITLATLILLTALAVAVIAGLRGAKRPLVVALLAACGCAAAEVLILSFGARQQIEFRHLAALGPLLLVSILGCLSGAQGGDESKFALISSILLAGVWSIADYRLLFLPENQWENFRGAVVQALALNRQSNAAIALVADPAAGAYYGLELTGEKPCFPLADSCQEGFSKVDWPRTAPAEYAVFWTNSQILEWLGKQAARGLPEVVIISTSRHPMYKDSPWWPILKSRKARIYPVHGFLVCYLR
jgi:hypothetical protein